MSDDMERTKSLKNILIHVKFDRYNENNKYINKVLETGRLGRTNEAWRNY